NPIYIPLQLGGCKGADKDWAQIKNHMDGVFRTVSVVCAQHKDCTGGGPCCRILPELAVSFRFPIVIPWRTPLPTAQNPNPKPTCLLLILVSVLFDAHINVGICFRKGCKCWFGEIK